MKYALMLALCGLWLSACGTPEEPNTQPDPFKFGPGEQDGPGKDESDDTTDDASEDTSEDDTPDVVIVIPPKPVEQQLFELDGVVGVQEEPSAGPYRVFTLSVRQPLDHNDPNSPTFIQRMYLFHQSTEAPMVLVTSGYGLGDLDSYRQFPVEIGQMVGGNHIFLGHRFFDGALPSGQNQDWSKVNIRQAAADNHRIVSQLKAVYDTPWIGTGWSKGGMTAIFHERFYPDDLDLVVPMVAPISLAPQDDRYPPALATIGTPECRQTLETSIIGALGRLDEFLDVFQIPDAQRPEYQAWFKSQIVAFAWGYWQYLGIKACGSIPDGTFAPIEDLANFYFYLQVPGPAFAIDEETAQTYTYTYQAETQLGYQDVFEEGYLERLQLGGHVTEDEVFQYRLPTRDQLGLQTPWDVMPAFDPAPMQDVDMWLRNDATDMLAVYGEFDPWTAAKVTLNEANGSKVYIVPEGTHGVFLQDLSARDFQEVRARIQSILPPNPNGLSRPITPVVDRTLLTRMLRDRKL